jgi:hypothetical protein
LLLRCPSPEPHRFSCGTFAVASCAGLWSSVAAMCDGGAPPIGAVGRICIDCVAEQRPWKSRNTSSSYQPIPIGMECDWVGVCYLLHVTNVPVQTPSDAVKTTSKSSTRLEWYSLSTAGSYMQNCALRPASAQHLHRYCLHTSQYVSDMSTTRRVTYCHGVT